MRNGDKRLTYTDRLKIEALFRAGHKVKEIARIIGKCEATIYRERKRGMYTHLNSDYTTEKRYSPELAQKNIEAKYSGLGPALKIGHDYKFAEYIERKIIKEHYSPAAALGDIINGKEKEKFDTMVCVRTIYNYIDKGVFLNLTNKDLLRKGKQKKKFRKTHVKKPPRGESIERRPAEVDSRETFGHWEMDSVIGKRGKSKAAFVVLTERMTREEIILLVPDHTAESVVRVLDGVERKYGEAFPKVFRTITVDNGTEFSDCPGLERSCLHDGPRTKFYYCHPYSSFERGSNENANGLIRRFYPKGSSFAKLTQKHVDNVARWINAYPRKIFAFHTAHERFKIECAKIF